MKRVLEMLLAALLLLPAGRVVAQSGGTTLPSHFVAIRDSIEGLVEGGALPSVTVVVIEDGQVVWDEAFGWADRESGRRATPETVYPVGSMSKSMTALGIMVLNERGRLNLDDPVTDHLPPGTIDVAVGDPDEVTIRRVLQMRGGFPHGWETYVAPGEDPPTIFEYLRANGVVALQPGTNVYSNNAYGVLEAVIEGAAGRPFAEFMRNEVFTPIGMSDASAVLTSELLDSAAKRYTVGGDRLAFDQSHFLPQGGAGGFASSRDLASYARFHLGLASDAEQIVSRPNLERMHFEEPMEGQAVPAGLGWASMEVSPGLHWLLTNGNISGASSMLTLIPERGFAVGILINASTGSADGLALAIADAAVPGFRDRVQARIASLQPEDETVRPGDAFVGRWQGTLRTGGAGASLSLEIRDDGTGTVRLAGQEVTDLDGLVVRNGDLHGRMTAGIPGHPVFGDAPTLTFQIQHSGGRLTGYLTANASSGRGSVRRPLFVSLTREDGAGW